MLNVAYRYVLAFLLLAILSACSPAAPDLTLARHTVEQRLGLDEVKSFKSSREIKIANAFSDIRTTGGREVAVAQTKLGMGQTAYIGKYKVSTGPNRVTFTLNNTAGSNELIMPAGKEDVFYIAVSGARQMFVDPSAHVNYNISETPLAPNTSLNFSGFAAGTNAALQTDYSLPGGGLRLALGPETNLTELGTGFTVYFQ